MEDINKVKNAILKVDPVELAEQITGKSYKDDEATSMLGFGLAMEHNKLKEAMLKQTHDTYFSMPFIEYLGLLLLMGFVIVYEEIIPKAADHGDKEADRFLILHNAKNGILFAFDTYWGNKSINGGNFYYNVAFPVGASMWDYTSSGHCINHSKDANGIYYKKINGSFYPWRVPEHLREMPDYDHNADSEYQKWKLACEHHIKKESGLYVIWAGYHDCREAVKFHIEALAENGEFLPVWKEQPHLWFCNYMDTKGDRQKDYNAICRAKYDKLPDNVKAAIGPFRD